MRGGGEQGGEKTVPVSVADQPLAVDESILHQPRRQPEDRRDQVCDGCLATFSSVSTRAVPTPR